MIRISNEYANPNVPDSEAHRRVDAAQSWLDGAVSIAERLNDAEVNELTSNTLQAIGVCRPDKEMYTSPVCGPLRPSVILVPLFREDANTTDTSRDLLNPYARQVASFRENTPGRIYVNADLRLSTLLKGLLLLHEAKHAQLYKSITLRNHPSHYDEETVVYAFEFRVISALDTSYRETINKLAQSFVTSFNHPADRKKLFAGSDVVTSAPLDTALGPSFSEEEDGIRRTIVWFGTVFRVLEKYYMNDAVTEKAAFLQQIDSAVV